MGANFYSERRQTVVYTPLRSLYKSNVQCIHLLGPFIDCWDWVRAVKHALNNVYQCVYVCELCVVGFHLQKQTMQGRVHTHILQIQKAFIYTVNTLYHWPKAEFMPERTRGTERLCQTQTYLSFPSNRDKTEPYQHRAAHSDQYTQTQLCNTFYTPAHLDMLHSVSLNQFSTFKSISKGSGWHKETERNSSGVTFLMTKRPENLPISVDFQWVSGKDSLTKWLRRKNNVPWRMVLNSTSKGST